jgi:ketosteroid isomerase-like protein
MGNVADPELERLLRDAYAAYSAGELDRALDYFAEDALYVNPPDALEQGTREGHPGVLAAWRALHEQFALAELEIHEIQEGDGCLLVIGRFRGEGRASGAPVDLRMNHVVRLREDLKVISLEWFFEREEAERAAGISTRR